MPICFVVEEEQYQHYRLNHSKLMDPHILYHPEGLMYMVSGQ